jgi:hypothetical protein
MSQLKNNMNIEQLCKTIETFNKDEQVEILKIIINKNNITSENSNGTFINMEDLKEDTIKELNLYVDYVLKKNLDIYVIENKKHTLKNNINENNNNKV